MGKINSVKKLTDNKFVNLYGVDATSVHDTPVSYFVASRAKSVEDMKLSTGENHPDGVIIYSVYGEKRDTVSVQDHLSGNSYTVPTLYTQKPLWIPWLLFLL